MPKPYDTRLVMMVAQNWFETGENQFCKLVPIVFVDGERPKKGDFPNDGEIWWMLTARSAMLAQPGHLVVGLVEDAVRFDEFDEDASRYQVKILTVQEVDAKDGMQVLELAGSAIASLQELVAGGFRLELAVRPTPVVMVRWRGHVYGPFTASSDQRPATALPGFALFPADTAGMTVFEIDETAFNNAAKGHRVAVSDEVSVTSHRRSESFELQPVKADFLLASGFERVLATNPRKLVLEPLDRKLVRYARQCLTRSKRQQLQSLLGELEVNSREVENAQELLEAIKHARSTAEKENDALNSVAEALLKSGLLGEDRLAKAEQAFAEKYVEERTAEFQAKIEAAIGERKTVLQQIEAQVKGLEAAAQKERNQRFAKLDEEIAAQRLQGLQSIATERAEFDRKKAELERQEGVLKTNLAQVTQELRNAGDEVVNRFLTIAPLLGMLQTGSAPRHTDPAEMTKAAPVVDAVFELPAFVRARNLTAQDGTTLAEQEFLDRFQRVVEESGFAYRPLDLLRFHLSVKCGDVTVLGGPSGTGKSSLPALYSHALLGGGGDQRPGCLMVNVSPSWMDTRDLLGHLNTLEGRFFPAETGLFKHLVCAEEEFAVAGNSTGMYLTCLDEMNLAQVEHYFSDLMMALERSGDERAIQCFAREAARPGSAFFAWARVRLSPSVRFVGTVNFDETTRLLSDRFLDRVNLIKLMSPALPGAAGPSGQLAKSEGRMVTLADFELWRSDKALPPELGGLLDQMRPLLAELGCAMSPRVYRALCRFVGSSDGVMPPSKAFDVQVAQRVLPKVRSLVTHKQMDAVDGLLRLMEQGAVCAFDESLPLLREARDAAGQRTWNLEETA